MALQVSEKQAQALLAKSKGAQRTKPQKQSRQTRAKRQPYSTRCSRCGKRFTQIVDEDRHLDETGHARYEVA